MPANLPPDYYAAERRFRQAANPGDKISILREMLAIMPKHKGTEHLHGDLKRKIAKLLAQADKKSATLHSSAIDHIPAEGAGQAVLIGAPNTGKSTLLSKFTHAESRVADYPFSTFKPIVGMMPFEDIQIQLIDMPPVCNEYSESWMFNIIRLADLLVLLFDMSSANAADELQYVTSILKEHSIELVNHGIKRPQSADSPKTTVITCTKADAAFNSQIPANYNYLSSCTMSAKLNEGFDRFKRLLFEGLHITRVYTKQPGKKPDFDKPYILEKGSMVMDAACMIHKDFGERMSFAKLWNNKKYNGQRVERQHVLEDKDIIEIHLK